MSDSLFDDLCDRFDAAWQAEEPERIEDVLSQIPAENRTELFRALLELELEYRLSAGETISLGEYEARFPDQTVTVADAFDEVKKRVGVHTDEDPEDTLIVPTEPMPRRGRSKSQVIGPYKLLQKIGEGGMGSVYMAEQSKPVRRRVALKLIRSGLDNQEVISRFEAERQALAMMDHPNIAKVLDAGTTDQGSPYFVMELVNGIPITEYCDKYKLSLDERLNLFVQSCKAIQHAHQKGIIHRDIKPSNVLVTQHDGVPVAKVIDFGLAKALQNTQRLTDATMFTEFGQVVGTLQYMSPEQAEMNALDVDTRSDVYSLGILLYELLTGSTPIEKQRLKALALDRVLAAIREEEAPRPSYRLSSLGDSASHVSEQRKTDPRKLGLILKGDLDWIAVKALEKDRTRRYDTASDLAEDVQRYLSGNAIEARPPSLSYRFQKVARKHRTSVIAGAVIGMSMVVALLVSTFMWAQATKARSEAEMQRNDAIVARAKEEVARKQADAALIESERQRKRADDEAKRATDEAGRAATIARKAQAAEARANYFLAVARWEAGRVDEANEFLDKVPEQHRHFEWHLAKRQFRGSDFTCYGHTDRVTSVSFSPDGTRIASASDDKTIKLWDAATGKELRTLKGHTSMVTSVSFSPDGTRIASGSWDNTIKLWDAATGQELRTLKGHTSNVNSVSFSPDGKRLYSEADSELLVWDVASGNILPDADWEPPSDRTNVTSDGLLAVPSGGKILLVDQNFKKTPVEKAYRKFKAKPKPWWHEEQHGEALQSNNAYATTFHAAWLLTLNPDSRDAYDNLHTSKADLSVEVQAVLPKIVWEALEIPKPAIPKLSESEAQAVNQRVWSSVAPQGSKPQDSDLEWMRAVVRDFPRGMYFKTLGVAEYRIGNYQEAIDACRKSVELTPGELNLPGPHAGDLAFLAMSHFQLGEMEKANDFRAKFKEAMKVDAFKDDEECRSFLKEVDALFATAAQPAE